MAVPKKKQNRVRRRCGPDGLTVRERLFVSAYVKTLVETNGRGHGKNACMAIGVPARSAAQRASHFLSLPHIKSAIAVHVDQMANKFDVSAERILKELAKMAFTGLGRFIKVTEDGKLYYDFKGATEEELDALSELTIDEYTMCKGDDAHVVVRMKVKMERKGALELLGRHHKLFTDNHALSNPDGTPLESGDLIVQFVEAKKEE